MINESDLKNFFSIADTKIKLTKQVKNYYGKELALNFNSFDFWWINENKVSEILAFFLNPKGNHEQGDIYLKHFLNKFNLDMFHYNEDDRIEVQCEYSTDNGRRIDIVINKNKFEQVVAIENKIYDTTADQKNQIKDYIDFLETKTKGEFCLIYLSPKEKQLSEESIKINDKENYINENKLKLITYEDQMIDCIKDFNNLTQNWRIKSFLQDFEKQLKKMYMGEKSIDIKQAAIELMNENETNIEISFLVSSSLNELKKELRIKFENQIKEIGQELNMVLEGTRLRPSKWTKHKISFTYEKGGLLFGITRDTQDKNKTRIAEIEDLLANEFNEKFQVSEWWPMWQFLYKNIETNEQFWLAIKNGKAKDKAKKMIIAINENFNTDKY